MLISSSFSQVSRFFARPAFLAWAELLRIDTEKPYEIQESVPFLVYRQNFCKL